MTVKFSKPYSSPPIFQYVCLALLFAGAMSFQIRYARDIGRGENIDFPFVTPATASAALEIVRPDAQKLGLRPGDILLAVNGQPYTGSANLAEAYAKVRPGDQIVLTVSSTSGERSFVLPVVAHTTPLTDIIFDVLLDMAAPIGCALLGSWVVMVRPRDKLAWTLLGLMLCFSQLFSAFKIESWGPGWREAGMAYHILLATGWPIFMFLFGFFFPEPFPFYVKASSWRRFIPVFIIVPILVNIGFAVAISIAEMTDYSQAHRIYQSFHPLESPLRIYIYCVVGVGFFGAISTKSATASTRDARRRLQMLYWGSTVALLPLFVLTLIALFRAKSIYDVAPDWIIGVTLLLTTIFPVTLAYVIVVQRAMDVRVVLRQGLQYGLAKNGIRVLQFIAIAIVIATALALGSNTNRLGKMVVIAIAVSVGFSIPRFGDRLRHWTDRRFFREAYDAEQVLSELSDHVRGMVETQTLIQTVAARISDTLHIPRIAVLLGKGGRLQPAYALGFEIPVAVTFPSNSGAATFLQAHNEPTRVYFEDRDSWLYRDPAINEEDRSRIADLQAELLLPLCPRDQLLGFISLGAKLSEEPYSGTDVRLLKSVATQTGLALENARLMSAIAEEVAQRERLNREVEIAREVQERLFPQTLPSIAGLSYSGACRPALGVGGDYYDFLALPEGQLGIAIGDVSGKGIAAALMMASLQASLRGEATRAPENLAALVGNVNRLVYEASSANRYATFFYAQYNPMSQMLTYVNAGHNPPMLFHCQAGAWQVSRLEAGGTVVGLLADFPYEQAAIKIQPGDLLIAFTDGISEAMNKADEEWGEKSLIDTVTNCAGLNPSEIITRIMQAADEFADGAKQHDDMTLVVLRASAGES